MPTGCPQARWLCSAAIRELGLQLEARFLRQARAGRPLTDGSRSSCLHLIHKSPCHKVKNLFLPLKHTGQNLAWTTENSSACAWFSSKTSTIPTKFPQTPVYVNQHLHLGPDLKSVLLFRLHYRNFTGLNWKNIFFQLCLALHVLHPVPQWSLLVRNFNYTDLVETNLPASAHAQRILYCTNVFSNMDYGLISYMVLQIFLAFTF